MKKLLRYLSPFAPDQSGACGVFYELGGLIVICDAGGCAGNICGFDEPRWFRQKSAIFSAGLRDMDAILGRDDLMIEKIQTTINNTIPLWKNQMVLSLGLAHSEQAVAAQSAVTEATNELLKKNAETLHTGAVEIAKESERSIVDLKTVK